jgi:hypothetical protein
MASFRTRFRKEIIEGVKSTLSHLLHFLRVLMIRSPGGFLLWTGVDEAHKLTIWMMTNIGPGGEIHVNYVLNGRKNSHGLLVWKRHRNRPGSGVLLMLCFKLLIFRFHFSFSLEFSDTGTTLPQINPAPHTSLLLFFPRQPPSVQNPSGR